MSAIHENGTLPQNITEDEAALYDRQIRLWGLEAQQRMRNATICVINLRGVATELIKNIVLAGIGSLIVVDPKDVSEEDLGAGFFFREDDIGKKRVAAARAGIEGLNPLVVVETISNLTLLDWDTLLQRVDIVCLTDGSRQDLTRYNDICRWHNKPFYAGGSYGLTGYIFSDLLTHEYISQDRSPNAEQGKTSKHCVEYPSFTEAMKHNWRTLTRKQARNQNAELIFSIYAIWSYELQHNTLPSAGTPLKDFTSLINSQASSAGIQPQVLRSLSFQQFETLAHTAAFEFSPVCAVLGGLLGQDVLKALGGRDPPIANLFVFDGQTGSGAVSRLNMST
ncbi:hypothetical protein BU17DRAFT_81694 [Hysterangium stoloniferum]|nr:hypothetical protein BU17DRAFT_81694 [Hysterangium stoloniferum]